MRTRLATEIGLEVLQGDGLAFGRNFGPVAEVDMTALCMLAYDLICNLYALPRSGVGVHWELRSA